MTTLQNPYTTTPLRDAYEQGRSDQADECSRHHMAQIADVLDAIHGGPSDVDQIRERVLATLGHGGVR
jgi:hypothetical protein